MVSLEIVNYIMCLGKGIIFGGNEGIIQTFALGPPVAGTWARYARPPKLRLARIESL